MTHTLQALHQRLDRARDAESVMPDKLRVLELFAGIGGFSLGLERTGGFETVAFCEIEEFPRKILKKHWPEVPCYHDVRDLTADTLSRVDVITGGFPCQDVSIAAFPHGRAGISGARSSLYGEVIRLAGEMGRPRLILENVRALLRDGLARVLQDLCALGYHAVWHVIPASHLGAIQPRERVWIIADTCRERMERLVSLLSAGQLGPRRARGAQDLQQIYGDPFGADDWPQPLLCGVDERPSDWMDRVKALGNTVYPEIPELIGHAILEAERAEVRG